jgi:hypothetical protein
MRFGPSSSGMAALHAVVPVAVPEPPRSLVHVTACTPLASAAVPVSGSVAAVKVKAGGGCGPVMRIDGPTASGSVAVTVMLSRARRLLH